MVETQFQYKQHRLDSADKSVVVSHSQRLSERQITCLLDLLVLANLHAAEEVVDNVDSVAANTARRLCEYRLIESIQTSRGVREQFRITQRGVYKACELFTAGWRPAAFSHREDMCLPLQLKPKTARKK